MRHKYIILLICTLFVSLAYSQKEGLVYYQLTIKNKIYPYYLAVEQDSFYFFSLAENEHVQLLNFGKTALENKEMQFLPVILPEGKVTIWELYGEDSIFYCHDNSWITDIDGDSIFLVQTNKGIIMLDRLISIGNVKQHKYAIMGTILVKDNTSKKVYSLPHLSDELVNSYGQNTIDYFFVQDDNTGIRSPQIQLSNPKPHLVLVDIYYPRRTKVDNYEPFYFFPRAKKWNYSVNKKQIIACHPTIFTFFDFYKTDFATNFSSKNGVYKTSKWTFNEVICPSEKAGIEVLNQKEKYQKKRMVINPECAEKATLVTISEYNNLPLKERQVRKKCKEKLKSIPTYLRRPKRY